MSEAPRIAWKRPHLNAEGYRQQAIDEAVRCVYYADPTIAAEMRWLAARGAAIWAYERVTRPVRAEYRRIMAAT